MRHLLIVAGEPSADRYAGQLIEALRVLDTRKELEIIGLGGFFMRQAGAHLTADFEGISHIGPAEALSSLNRYWNTFRTLLSAAETYRPRAAILMDFPDFNLPLAKRLKRMGVRVLYYISPQVWAWRRGRIRTIARWVDQMFVIFPFEVEFYRRHGMDVEFVGHPILERNPPAGEAGSIKKMLRVAPNRPFVSLFPGSRQKEVGFILPGLMEAMLLISRRCQCHFAIVKANGIDEGFVKQIWKRSAEVRPELGDGTIPIDLIDSNPEEVLADSDAAIVKSGTATLQAALAGVPFVMVYKISSVSWMIGKLLVRTPYYCIVNLIAGRPVVTELLQEEASPDRIAEETLALIQTKQRRQVMQQAFEKVRRSLGSRSASETMAARIASEIGLTPSDGPAHLDGFSSPTIH